MARQVVFFPEPGEPHSTAEFIDAIKDKTEQERINLRLRMLSEREPYHWNLPWCKPFGEGWQLRTEHFRVFLVVEHTRLVVLHAFKKQSGKTAKKDLQRERKALQAYQAYMDARKHPGK